MTAIQASSSFPPQDAWMAGETVNYYYLGHLLLALPAHALSLEPSTGYNLAVAGLFALSASAVFTLAGTLWAAALARGVHAAGGPVGAGLAAVALCLVLGDLAGAREWLQADEPARRLRLVRRLARDPGHDQRVPGVLVHARGPARARARDPVHAARARLRAAGGARRAARRPGVARGRRGARRRPGGRRAVRDQLVVVSGRRRAAGRRRRRLDARAGGGRAAGVRRRLDRARARGRVRARAAVLAGLRPGRARDRRRRPSTARSRAGRATWR